MSDKEISEESLSILIHSLGLDRNHGGKSYRNYFVAGGNDEKICKELVSEGFMVEREGSRDIYGGNACFHVTDEGIEYVRKTGVKFTFSE